MILFHLTANDYLTTIETLIFNSTISTISVSIPIIDDDVDEITENFFADLALITVTDRVNVAPAEATVSIVDNDGEWLYMHA